MMLVSRSQEKTALHVVFFRGTMEVMKTKILSVVVAEADAAKLGREAKIKGLRVSDVIRERLGCAPIEPGGFRRGGGRPKREAS